MWLLSDFAADVRFAIRTLGRNKAFATMAVVTLAMGLGTNTAVFSAFDAVLVKNLPVKNPHELVTFDWLRTADSMVAGYSGYGRQGPAPGTGIRTSFSPITLERFRQSSQTLADVFAFADRYRLSVDADGQTDTASGQAVSGNYFAALGVPALMGRALTPLDDTADASPVAVITHRYWQRRFAADPNIVGRSITVNRSTITIVGVTPEGFNGTLMSETSDLTVPLAKVSLFETSGLPKPASTWWVRIMARMKPGQSPAQVHDELRRLFEESVRESWAMRTAATPNQTRAGMPTLRVLPGGQGPDGPRRDAMQEIGVAMAIVGTVLLIGCANVANLLLVRGLTRRREIAVRLALGASRSRVVRLLFAESLVLALAGGGLGLAVAFWARDFMTWLPSSSTPIVDAAIDLRVIAFSFLLSAFTAVLFGFFPALRSMRSGLYAATTNRSWRGLAGRVMVVVQVAACVTLVAGAGLALQTVRNLNAVDVGFNTDDLLVFRIDLGERQGTDVVTPSRYEELAAAIDGLPGVQSATFSAMPLLANMQWSETVQPDGGREAKDAYFQAVRWNFFQTVGMRLRSGRALAQGDHARSTPVAVVNETMARELFGDENPIGRHFQLLTGARRNIQIEVIGIVNDAKYSSVKESSPPTFYVPSTQFAATGMTFEVRTATEPSGLIPLVRDVVKRQAPGVALANVKTQAQQIADTMAQPRALAMATGVFSLVGVLLACLGIFGVVSYDVTQRTRELAIRIALGARRSDVFRLVFRDVLVVTLAGAVIGVALVVGGRKVIAGVLFGVTPADPVILTASVSVLAAAAIVAAFWPARRAARLNPNEALRVD